MKITYPSITDNPIHTDDCCGSTQSSLSLVNETTICDEKVPDTYNGKKRGRI